MGKFAEFFGIGNSLGSLGPEPSSLPLLSKYLVYEACSGDVFSLKNGFLGAAFEVEPIVGMSEELEKNIKFFFSDDLPNDYFFQITVIASHKIDKMLKRYKKERISENPMIQKMTEQREKFLSERALDFSSAVIVRDYKFFISIVAKTDNMEKFFLVKNQIVKKLETLCLSPKSLGGQDLIDIVNEMLQMEKQIDQQGRRYNILEPLAQQCATPCSPVLIKEDQIEHISTKLSSKVFQVMQYPENFSLSQMIQLLGDGTRETLSIPARLIISLTIAKNIQNSDQFIPKGQAVMHSAEQVYARHNLQLQQEASEWIEVIDKIKSGEKVLNACFLVMLTTDQNLIDQAQSNLVSLYNMNNWKIKIADKIQLTSLLSMLPMQAGYYFQDLCWFKLSNLRLSSELLAMLPLHGEWKGVPVSGVPFVGRRGQLFNWNPFFRISGGNYNICIFGPSGSGKSVFLQELAVCTLAQNAKVFILDIGQSFKNICLLLGGEMIKFSPDMDISLNPFSLLSGTDDKEVLMCLQAILVSMCGANGKSEEAQMEKALIATIKKHGTEANITRVAEELSDIGTQESKRMSMALFSYTIEGQYGHYFDRPSNIHFSQKLTVFEFEEIKNDPRLLSVVLQLISMQVFLHVLTGDRQSKFMLIVDEAWMILDHCAKFLSDLARTIRKYGGSLVVCVQSYDDFQKTEEHKTIFQNSTWTLMLKQDEKGLNSFKQSEAFKDMIGLIRSIQFRPGKFSECLLYTTGISVIGRIMLDRYSSTLFSTDAADFNFISNKIKTGIRMDQAAQELMEWKESKK